MLKLIKRWTTMYDTSISIYLNEVTGKYYHIEDNGNPYWK